MPRRRVELQTGEHYHVYNRGVDRQRIFFDNDNFAYFLRKLRQFVSHPAGNLSASSPVADVLAYCLMPNHYHLLVRLHSLDFSDAMQSFGQSYTQAVNRRFDRTGPLFESRFQAIHVDREEYLMHLSRYIHLNPVKGGLVSLPEQWEYSSYREYVGSREGTLPQPDAILQSFRSRNDYGRFVEAGIGNDDPLIRHLITD